MTTFKTVQDSMLPCFDSVEEHEDIYVLQQENLINSCNSEFL